LWFSEAGLVLYVLGGGAVTQSSQKHVLDMLEVHVILCKMLFIGEIYPLFSFLMQQCWISMAEQSISHRLFFICTQWKNNKLHYQ